MIKKIDHIVITTACPTKCIEFYQKLGFSAHDAGGRYELFSGDFKINVHIKGSELLPHAKNVQTGSADLCFEIDTDIFLAKETLQNQGISIELGVVQRSGTKGQMQSIYIRDPDQNLVELSSYQ